ncbi:MAG: ABC transporter ATP-binding protein [Acidimicrobiia bacterium]|nr:ABC transporter ATP-binding protein [Acidimicrobiia bacterium]
MTIVGPSGCGKTTLLRIISGLIEATAGTARLNGTAIAGPSRSVGMVFQSPVLLPSRTALENVLIPIDIQRKDRKASLDDAQRLIDLVGLRGYERNYPHEMSGGMQQRVAICRALIHDPEVLLMDEPFGALDALTREQMNLELQRVWMSSGKTVLMITHSIPEAVFLGSRVIVMSRRPGSLIYEAGITEPRPRDLSFMGTPEFGRLSDGVRTQIQSNADAA